MGFVLGIIIFTIGAIITTYGVRQKNDTTMGSQVMGTAIHSAPINKGKFEKRLFYQTTYEIEDKQGNKNRILDEHLTEYPIKEGTQKSFTQTSSGKTQDETSIRMYIKNGIIFMIIGILTIIPTIISHF